MREILDTVMRWLAAGERVAVATLVATSGATPRMAGAAVAISGSGSIAGSLSGGCIEADVYEAALDCIAGGRPRMLRYGATTLGGTGLTCGGTLEVFVRAVRPGDTGTLEKLARSTMGGRPIAYLMPFDGPDVGVMHIVESTTSDVDRARVRCIDGYRTFAHEFAPKPDMYVFGAVDFSRAMASVGKLLGYRVTVVDARPAFATRERVPDADAVVVAWPDEFLANARVSASTVLVVLTHDVKFDTPLLRVAFESEAGYIGVMGSRQTHAHRVASLRAEGVGEMQLARLRAPVGLDIGASTPEETAISIAAEIIAVRNGRVGGALRDGAASLRGPFIPIDAEALRSA